MKRTINFETVDGGNAVVFVDDILYVSDIKFNRPNDSKAKDYTLVQLRKDNWLKAKANTALNIQAKIKEQIEIDFKLTQNLIETH